MTYGLSSKTIRSIQEVFTHYPQIDKAILYGSRARNNYRRSSDIDITLMGTNLSLSLLAKVESEIDDLLLPYEFDISCYQSIKNTDLKRHIDQVGKVFYTKDCLPQSLER
ncbi:nucleotidyltransferase domain-containing protein [Tunicatimonas pelagia]|uniref:nucleotidyltransferase domain-containing protein n=1 Tax=Tunicatimonas pelagia TaxID=931531 RepID=UPI002665B09E|nr:nucleotidyltransferase domain-containing protein [Tunicatimonas pelagia]WKN43955.1 nucleotidyltransferase domain-containing protein [Tunicatimonas pelagia]